MKYLLLCALLISGAFFSLQLSAQQFPSCPAGGSFSQSLGLCVTSTKKESTKEADCGGYLAPSSKVTGKDYAALAAQCRTYANSQLSTKLCIQNKHDTSSGVRFYQSVSPSASSCSTMWNGPFEIFISNIRDITADSCPPDTAPQYTALLEQSGTKYCTVQIEPCDCSGLTGSGTLPYTSFTAQKGVYSSANPPQCNTVTDPDTGQQCNCQLIAQKWLETGSGEYSTWSPLPYDKDKPSGTYTGAACGDTDASEAPPEPEQCFTLKSGQKWCFANPQEQCTVINGQEQCSTGCGYMNGDFVCYEESDPVIPERENDELNDIDDTLTDPDKTMQDINKADLKQIQSGTEQRLDNLVIATGNNNNQLQNIGDKIDVTNDNLEGIGKQLDGQGKSLKGIADGIEDAFGDDGAPDGACEGDCTGSWYESVYPDGIVGIWEEHSASIQQTPAFEFLGQFQMSPDGAQPDMNFCFNLGAFGDYGCKSIEVPAFVWAFLKICILISAAFLCRALIFGG